ncbi:5'-3' exonuclease H3TH domain-containing protein [Escherichia coli]
MTPADNIPGVPGVGGKNRAGIAARSWRAGYAVCRARKNAGLSFRGAKTMAAKLKQKLEKVLISSYQLATIKTDVELELTCEQLEVQQPAAEELLGLFAKSTS